MQKGKRRAVPPAAEKAAGARDLRGWVKQASIRARPGMGCKICMREDVRDEIASIYKIARAEGLHIEKQQVHKRIVERFGWNGCYATTWRHIENHVQVH